MFFTAKAFLLTCELSHLSVVETGIAQRGRAHPSLLPAVTLYLYFQRTPRNFQKVEDLGMEGSVPQGTGPASKSRKWSILDCGDDAPLAEEPSRQKLNLAHTLLTSTLLSASPYLWFHTKAAGLNIHQTPN